MMFRQSLLALALVASSLATNAEENSGPASVRDLSYGVMLYQYFLNKPLQALTESAIAKSRGGMKGHGQHPLLLEGGIRLQFGMDKLAEQTFTKLLDANATPKVRSQAWFYLAKIAYQRQQFQRASELLTKVDKRFLPVVFDEFLLLQSNIAVRTQQLDTPISLLAEFDESSMLLPYAHYNAGVAWQHRLDKRDTPSLLGGNLWQYAVAQFDAVVASCARFINEDVESDEYKALSDRANLAAGYVLLQANQYEGSIEHFRSVRLDGPYANDAMLGYGWAATEAKHFQVALTPWQHLSEQALMNAAVQESFLALPYIYEKLGAPAQALAKYEQSAKAYQSEILRLNDEISGLASADLMALFVEELGDGPVNWVLDDAQLRLKQHSPYLSQLLSEHGFHASLMDLRDIQRLKFGLLAWQDKLSVFQDAGLGTSSRALSPERIADLNLTQRLTALRLQRDAAQKALATAQRTNDWSAVLEGQAYSQSQRIESNMSRLSRLKAAGEDVQQEEQRLLFLQGLMHWQSRDEFSINLRKAQRQLKEVDQEILTLEAYSQRLNILSDKPELSVGKQQAISDAQARVVQMLQTIDRVSSATEKQLLAQAATHLTAQRDNIVRYLAQVRVSITRLYDLSAVRNGELD